MITIQEFEAMPTVNTEALEQDYDLSYKRRKKNRKQDDYLDQLL